MFVENTICKSSSADLNEEAKSCPYVIESSYQDFNIDHMHCDKITDEFLYKPRISTFKEHKVRKAHTNSDLNLKRIFCMLLKKIILRRYLVDCPVFPVSDELTFGRWKPFWGDRVEKEWHCVATFPPSRATSHSWKLSDPSDLTCYDGSRLLLFNLDQLGH